MDIRATWSEDRRKPSGNGYGRKRSPHRKAWDGKHRQEMSLPDHVAFVKRTLLRSQFASAIVRHCQAGFDR
jgi:hypothetical protein